MLFALFCVLSVTLFVRPSEIVPGLLDLPIYEWLILGCLGVGLGAILAQLRADRLYAQPITAGVVGMLVAVVLSQLAHLAFRDAFISGIAFLKILLFYLLLMSTIDTPSRYRAYLSVLNVCILILTLLALLHYHGLADIPALEAYHERQDEVDDETGEIVVLARIRSAGIYNNPNDLARIVTVGFLLSMYLAGDRRRGPSRLLWLGPLAAFAYTLILTYSRGGLLGLIAGLAALLLIRLGPARAMAVVAAGVPALLLFLGGRLAKIDTSGGTGQERIRLWNEGFVLFFRSPVFGIGMDRYVEEVGLAAHNSFLHCFTETGLVGGILFVGVWYTATWALYRLGAPDLPGLDREFARASPYVVAIGASTIVGMMSSTRTYSLPTYLVLGLAASYFRIASAAFHAPSLPRLDKALLGRWIRVGLAALIGLYAYVRLAVHY